VNAGPTDGAAVNGYHPAPLPSVFQSAHFLSGARANKRQRDRMIRVAVQHPIVAINFARSFVLIRINSL
jgi:hypothetical protein